MKKDYKSILSSWHGKNRIKTMLLSISMLLIGLSSSAQLFEVAGNCTMTVSSNNYGPMNSIANPAATSRTAIIYPASQLVGLTAQELTKAYFNRIGSAPDPTGGTPNFKLYLKETTSIDFGGSAVDWATAITGATLVYDSNPLTALQGGIGWKEFAFSTNFTYSGTDNLMVLMEYVNTGNTTLVEWQYEFSSPCVNTTNNNTTAYINNTTGTLGTSLTSKNYRRAQIAFDYSVLCPSPSNILLSGISSTEVTIDWTAGGTESDWDYAIQPQGSGLPTTFLPATSNSLTVNTLTPSTNYEFYVRANCGGANGESIWIGPYPFSTTQILAVIPFTDDFSTSSWGFSNGTQENKWFIGAAAGNPANGMYISNDNGVSNTYSLSPISVTQAYRDVTFPAGLNTFNLSFDWKAVGESSWDYLRVWIVPAGSIINSGTQISTSNTPGAVQLGGNLNQSATWVTENRIIPASYAGTNARIVFEWRNDGTGGTQTPAAIDNVNMSVISCPAPTALVASNATTTSMDLTWTENGSASDWEISYGTGSFTPGSGTIVTATTNPFTVTGLNPSSTYKFYVRSNCSPTDSSTWFGPVTALTLCAPITALPWTENFDNLTTVSTTSFPPCWLNENPSPAVWSSSSNVLSTITAGPLSPANYLRVRYNSDATMWTPEFNLTAGQTYELTFNWAGNENSGWEGSVYVNGSQSSTGATMIGAKFVENTEVTTFDYQKESYCFVPTISGTYAFGVKVKSTTSSRYMSFDDFELKSVNTNPGVDGVLSVCSTGSPVDLNTVITAASANGSWSFGLNPTAVTSAGILNAGVVPAGVHNFYYITEGCAADTTVAKITVVAPSSAGNEGSIAVCRNQPFSLLSGLSGNADLGGVWTDPNGAVVPNGNYTSSNIPGQYNFTYIVSNGVCPADTAKIVVNVTGCDHTVGLEDLAFEGFNLYPNPSSDLVYISNTGSTEVFNYEVLDMNGRVILKANQAINGSTTTELNLSEVEVGVYMIRVFNQNADKTFRVVKN